MATINFYVWEYEKNCWDIVYIPPHFLKNHFPIDGPDFFPLYGPLGLEYFKGEANILHTLHLLEPSQHIHHVLSSLAKCSMLNIVV